MVLRTATLRYPVTYKAYVEDHQSRFARAAVRARRRPRARGAPRRAPRATSSAATSTANARVAIARAAARASRDARRARAMTVDVDVTPARASRDADAVRRRRWGAAPAVRRDDVVDASDRARDDDGRAFRNAAAPVEDPGECERAASSLWGASSWFSGRVDARAREANAASAAYGEGWAGDASERAPGGATCQNRFIEGRGARDPFAPASRAGTRLDESSAGRAREGGDGWKITRWDATMVRAGEGEGGSRKPGYRAFAGGEARRLAERPTGATFEFDSARQCWLLIRDGESREVERPPRAMDSPSVVSSGDDECSTDAMDATTVDVDAFAESGDKEAFDVDDDDDEIREMREKTREERIRRYQPSYDDCAARFVDRERERRDRFEASRRTLAERRAAPRTTPTKRRSEDLGDGIDASQQSTWIPLTCDCGVKVWIEASPAIDPSAQLASWVNGDVPWPVVRTLDLGRDRASRGIPRNAPGPVCVDPAALAAVEAELRRRHDENVEQASQSKRPNARAVDPTHPDAVKHASIIDTLVRETTKSSPSDVDASLSIHEQRALRSKLEATIREKHAALAECERLRDLLRRAGVEP